jgi:hypothetical protein
VDRFIAGDVLWPVGESRLHVYVLPEPDLDVDLAALLQRCRRVLEQFDFLVPVAEQWLHTTVQMVTGRPAVAIDEQARQQLTDELTRELTAVRPFVLRAGGPSAGRSGVVLDLDGDQPGDPFLDLYQRVRHAISTVLGPGSIEYGTLPAHLTLAYAGGPGDSGLVQSALRRQVRPATAPMSVRAVHLLDVVQDATTNEYQWTSLASIPLTD